MRRAMRVLGVEVSGSESRLVILDGTAEECLIELLPASKLPLPPDSEQVKSLIALKNQIYGLLKSKHVECVGVIRADGGCSPIRAKVECVIQMAAADAVIPCTLVAPQTVAAAEKRKVSDVAGANLQEALRQISPAYLRKAAYCGWTVINGKQ
jgi:hypothetical protein